MQSKYEATKAFLKTRKAKNMKMDFDARMVLLAIAKECDKQKSESVELSDDEILELTKEETILHLTMKVKELYKLFGRNEVKDEETYGLMHYVCSTKNIALEELYPHLLKVIKIFKQIPKELRHKSMQEIMGKEFQLQ